MPLIGSVTDILKEFKRLVYIHSADIAKNDCVVKEKDGEYVGNTKGSRTFSQTVKLPPV